LLTLYICLGYCFAPLAFLVQVWRGFRDRSHWHALGERFGFGPRLPPNGIWLHAVSVGEVQAAAALVRGLKERFPGRPLLITTATVTGRARALALFGTGAAVSYLPYDLPGATARFLERAQPQVAVILETELWPNLYRGCARRGIPVVLASARVSERSVRRYRAFGSLIPRTLATGVLIAAQSADDADRFAQLGASRARIHVAGNIKFDVELPAGVEAAGARRRGDFGASRPVWVAGSTHAGEETAALDAHEAVAARLVDALLVLAPRHPPRFDAVASLLERRGVAFARQSRGERVTPATRVLLLDTLGELIECYAAGDVAFVGGSLVPIGGHNLLEPAALGRAVLAGPYTGNAAGIANLLSDAGALTVVEDARELAARLGALLCNPEARAVAGEKGRAVIEANRGAIRRVLALIEPLVRD